MRSIHLSLGRWCDRTSLFYNSSLSLRPHRGGGYRNRFQRNLIPTITSLLLNDSPVETLRDSAATTEVLMSSEQVSERSPSPCVICRPSLNIQLRIRELCPPPPSASVPPPVNIALALFTSRGLFFETFCSPRPDTRKSDSIEGRPTPRISPRIVRLVFRRVVVCGRRRRADDGAAETATV